MLSQEIVFISLWNLDLSQIFSTLVLLYTNTVMVEGSSEGPIWWRFLCSNTTISSVELTGLSWILPTLCLHPLLSMQMFQFLHCPFSLLFPSDAGCSHSNIHSSHMAICLYFSAAFCAVWSSCDKHKFLSGQDYQDWLLPPIPLLSVFCWWCKGLYHL